MPTLVVDMFPCVDIERLFHGHACHLAALDWQAWHPALLRHLRDRLAAGKVVGAMAMPDVPAFQPQELGLRRGHREVGDSVAGRQRGGPIPFSLQIPDAHVEVIVASLKAVFEHHPLQDPARPGRGPLRIEPHPQPVSSAVIVIIVDERHRFAVDQQQVQIEAAGSRGRLVGVAEKRLGPFVAERVAGGRIALPTRSRAISTQAS